MLYHSRRIFSSSSLSLSSLALGASPCGFSRYVESDGHRQRPTTPHVLLKIYNGVFAGALSLVVWAAVFSPALREVTFTEIKGSPATTTSNVPSTPTSCTATNSFFRAFPSHSIRGRAARFNTPSLLRFGQCRRQKTANVSCQKATERHGASGEYQIVDKK